MKRILRRAVARYLAKRSPRWRWGMVVLWGTVIWILSSRPTSGIAPSLWVVLLFNGAHVVLFGMLAALAHLAGTPDEPRASLRAIAIAAAWGTIDEIHQTFVPGRSSSLWDVATDVAGAVLFVSVVVVLRGEGARWARIATPLAAVAAAVTVTGATFG